MVSALLTERELARRWRKSVRTLQRWRRDGTGPAFIRIGASPCYRWRDILDHEDACRHAGGSEEDARDDVERPEEAVRVGAGDRS